MGESFKVFLKLLITGDEVLLDEVTSTLNIDPTKILKKGDRKRKNLDVYHEINQWELQFYEGSDKEVDNILDDLQAFLKDKESCIFELSKKMDICIFFAIYKGEYIPGLCVKKRHIQFMSDIGARLDFDIYC